MLKETFTFSVMCIKVTGTIMYASLLKKKFFNETKKDKKNFSKDLITLSSYSFRLQSNLVRKRKAK